ncbi:MAG: ABC transporter ATP-binding protein [Rhizobiaceae bacterium]|nr:ABC transporter ATP-binding protein [Rhizobiaceae bacterium]
MAELKLEALTKTYDSSRNVLDGIDLVVRSGEFISLLGPSGCGKSTALRIIAGLIEPSSGRVLVGDRDITDLPAHARNAGLVFQSYALFPHMTVADNISFGLEMRGAARRNTRKQVEEALAMVRLEGLGGRMPKQLSGGQQQRVALARALVIRPDILLLDEPLSNLDAKLREEMRSEIRDLQLRSKITTVFVTHDQEEALTMSDRVAVMQRGQIIQSAIPTELYEQPATAEVAAFIGRVNRLDGVALRRQGDRTLVGVEGTGEIWVPRAFKDGERVTVMFRPHKLHFGAKGGGAKGDATRLDGEVSKVVYSGGYAQVYAKIAGKTILAECPSHHPEWKNLSPGDRISLWCDVADTLAYAESEAN